MPNWEFPGSDPIDVFIDLASGHVALTAEPTAATRVELVSLQPGRNADRLLSDTQVTFGNGRLEVTGPKHSGIWRSHAGFDLTITVPPGSRCALRTASADISCTGDLAELNAHTASGDLTAATVTGHVQAQTSSGDIRLGDVGTAVDVRTTSGDLRLARVGHDLRVRSASGDLIIGAVGGPVNVVTASGDVRIASLASGRTDVRTTSGDMQLGVATGAGVYLDLASLSGSVTSQLDEAEPSDDVLLTVVCRTVSGDVRIARAPAAQSQAHRSFPGLPVVSTPEAQPPAV